MVVGPAVQAIEALHTGDASEQVAALKQLKNDIVGHELRKELVVKQGVVSALANILASNTDGKKNRGDAPLLAIWTDATEARLQATLVLGSLASGGPAFVAPLLAADIHKHLFDALATHAAPKLVTASLQVLKSLAASSAEALDDGPRAALELGLSDKHAIDAFLHLLRQPSASTSGRQQLRLSADIIALITDAEVSQSPSVHETFLDALAALLASYAVASRHVDGISSGPRVPGPPTIAVPNILAAISSLIGDSKYRAHRFLLLPAFRDVFDGADGNRGDQRHTFGPRYGFLGPNAEPLLPPIHVPAVGTTTYYHGPSRAFPAQAALQADRSKSMLADFGPNSQGIDLDHANAICGWLLVLARSMHGHDRLVALNLLAQIHHAVDNETVCAGTRSEFVQKTRECERQMALLAIPMTVGLVKVAADNRSAPLDDSADRDVKLIRESACSVLAALIMPSRTLQVAAVEAGANRQVCPILKKTFDHVPLSRPMWSASKSANADAAQNDATCKLGAKGLPAEISHMIKCRHGALMAIAALAQREDAHRKAIVDAGIIPCIIDSLKPPTISGGSDGRSQVGAGGRDVDAMIFAACNAARSMSRSVSLLRTSLIDAGIAKPIAALLLQQNRGIQLAATDVCINLLLEFSPMRELLVEQGIIKTLTEHARSDWVLLRLSSLWALKHLVLNNTRQVKLKTLEDLGSGWLVGAIQGEQTGAQSLSSNGGGVSIGVSGSNAAGEQVDLLNPATSTNMDLDDEEEQGIEDDDGDEFDEEDGEEQDDDGEMMYDESSSTHYQASQLRSTLAHTTTSSPAFNSKKHLSSILDLEQNPALQAKRDDAAVQEQALDFVRNLLNGEQDCAFMLDHLLHEVGTPRFFDLLTTKLSPLPYSTRLAGGSGSGQVYNPVDILHSTISILTHIANALPRHKQLLIAQKPLLHAWLPHFSHHERKIRVMCVWAVTSLTWIDDESDKKEARQRALELRAVGIEEQVRKLQGDADLDVKERVKTVIRQFDGLL